MRKLLCILLLATFAFVSHAQIVRTLSTGGSALNDEPTDVIRHSQNKIVTTGYFNQAIEFGSFTLPFKGNDDAFITCQNADGSYQWAKSIAGPLPDRGSLVKEDGFGNIYVAGYFRKNASVGNDSILSDSLSQDVFVAKFTVEGTLLWIRAYGGSGIENVTGLSVTASGDIWIAGQFSGTARFGSHTFNSTEFFNSGQQGYDIYMTKISGNGDVITARTIESPENDRVTGLASDLSGNLFMTLHASGLITAGSQQINLSSSSGVLLRMDNGGAILSSKSFVAPFLDIRSLDLKGQMLVIGGNFTDVLSCNDASFPAISDDYQNRIFGICMDLSLGYLSHFSESSESNISLNDVAFNSLNQVWAGGSFNCTLNSFADDLGSGLFNNIGNKDVFVGLYASSSSNTRKFEQHLGGKKEDNLNSIFAGNEFYPTIAGSYQDKLVMMRPSACFDCENYNPDIQGFSSNCNVTNYNDFIKIQGNGSLDIFCSTALDTLRPVLDIYFRGGGCDYSVKPPGLPQGDSSIYCSNFQFWVENKLAYFDLVTYSTTYNFNSAPSSGYVNQTGLYVAQITTADGCRAFSDSVYIQLFDSNDNPELSVLGGTLYPTTFSYFSCANHIPKELNDSITVIGEVFNASDSLHWWKYQPPLSIAIFGTDTNQVTLTEGGAYRYFVITEQGCYFSSCFTIFNYVIIQLPNGGTSVGVPGQENGYVPNYEVFVNGNPGDTVQVCPSDANEPIKFEFSDSLLYSQLGPFTIPAFGYWEITGAVTYPAATSQGNYPFYSFYNHFNYAVANYSGWVTIRFSLLLPPENQDTLLVFEKQVFIVYNTPPAFYVMFTTSTQGLCPGDTLSLDYELNLDVPYTLSIDGEQVNPDSASLEFIFPATVTINVNSTDPATTCHITANAVKQIVFKQAPDIDMDPLNGKKCPEDSVMLTAVPGLDITWIGPQGETIGTNFSLFVVPPGLYYYNLIDPDGCPLLSNSAEVRNITAVVLDSIITENICGNDPALIKLAPDPNLNYTWLAPLSGSDTIKYISQPGIYSVRVALCSNVDTLVFEVKKGLSDPYLDFTDGTVLCEGKTLELTANDSAQTYQWQPGNLSSQNYVVSGSGWVNVTVSDTIGCVLSDSIYVEMHPTPPTPDSLVSGDACPGTPITVTAESSFPMAWHAHPDSVLIAVSSSITVDVIQDDQNISAYAVDPATGCKSEWVSKALTLLTLTNISALPESIIFCPGDTVNIQPQPVAGIATGIWTGPASFGQASNNLLLPDIDAAAAGQYTYTAISEPGFCTYDTGAVELVLRLLPQPEITFDDTICARQNLTFAVMPVAGQSYIWTGPASLSHIGGAWTIADAVTQYTGEYFLTSNSGNCNRTDSVFVFVSELPPDMPLLGYDATVCIGDTLFLFNADSVNTSGVNLTWLGSDGFMQNSPNSVYLPDFQPAMNAGLGLQMGINQCISEITYASIEIKELPAFSFNDPFQFCEGDPFELESPVPASGYLWSSGETNSVLTVFASDTVYLTITDDFGCRYTDVAVVEALNCDLDDTPNTFSPNNDGINDEIVFTVSGGVIYSARIYDRWGRLCKTLEGDKSTWDGTTQSGEKVLSGTYFYLLSVEMLNGKEKELQGTITVFD